LELLGASAGETGGVTTSSLTTSGCSGRLKRKPWALSQPAACRFPSWSLVSTPSATTAVERRRAAVPDRARMNNEAAVLRVHRLRDDLREEGADDQLGPVRLDGGLHGRARVHHRHRHLMSELGQRDLRPLAQAVVRRDEEEDAETGPRHGHPRRCVAAQRVGPTTQDLVELDGTAHAELRRLREGTAVYDWTNALARTRWR
jgi:hypothetical protein